MTITNKQIRDYLGHNGEECRVLIRFNGRVYRHGSPDPFDRSKDYWRFVGYVNDIKNDIEAVSNI